MIQRLLQQIITLFEEGFNGLVADNDIHVGPISAPTGNGNLPALAVHPGAISFERNFTDQSSSEPRPQEGRQDITIDNNTGPYNLNNIPLEGSALASIIYNVGVLGERRKLIQENKDFTINYQTGSIELDNEVNLTDASLIRIKYSFPGIFALREFQQDFFIDAYDNEEDGVEIIASLASAMILTQHDSLLEDFNDPDNPAYLVTTFRSTHNLTNLYLLSGIPDFSNNTKHLRLTFQVRGQLHLSRSLDEPAYLIEKIRSRPEVDSPHAVDIDAELG